MVNGAHTRLVRTRSFYGSNVKNANMELNDSKSDIVVWYNEFRAFDTIVPSKTYAQALSTNVNSKVKKFECVSNCKKVGEQNRCLDVGKHKAGRPKVLETKQIIHHGKQCKKNNITDHVGSVAKTTQQNLQDPLVLSNRFQMLQHFVDNQEQEQQIPHQSSASVQSMLSNRNNVQKNKYSKNNKNYATETQVDDDVELLLAHQVKNLLVGNKHETGPFDGESQDVISSRYQTSSVADTNTHEPDLETILTGNCDLNSIEHEKSCSKFLVQTKINKQP